jgi:hypothetical protein
MRLISGLVMAAAVAASVSGCALEDEELQIDELTGQLAGTKAQAVNEPSTVLS